MKYAGKVGTGFTMKSARSLYDRLAGLEVDVAAVKTNLPRFIRRATRRVRPSLVCEVTFTEWTADGRIRHPSFQGLRDDKKPQEVTAEKPVQSAAPEKQNAVSILS
jgi:bifunctional non-homologous end joining protein LigD